jgi:hypothetical protein
MQTTTKKMTGTESDKTTGTDVKPGFSAEELAKIQKAQDEASKKSVDAIKSQHDLMSAESRVEAASMQQIASKKEADVAQEQKIMGQYQEEFTGKLNSLSKMTTDLMSQKIDPQRLWKESTTAGQVSVGIAMALGALGSRDGSNKAVDVFNKAIDRDIAAQEVDLNNKFKAIGQQQSLLKVNMENFKDMQQARLATRNVYYSAIENQLKANLARVKGNEGAQAQAAQALAVLEQQKAANTAKLVELGHNEVVIKTQDTVRTTNKKEVDTTPVMKDAKAQADLTFKVRDEFTKHPAYKTAQDIGANLRGVDEDLAMAGKGDAGASNAVRGKLAKISQGAGVLSDQDLKTFGLTGSTLQELNKWFTTKTEGTLTPQEMQSAKNIIAAGKFASTKNLAVAAKDVMPLVKSFGVDARNVLGDSTIQDFSNAEKRDRANAAFKKHGGK